MVSLLITLGSLVVGIAAIVSDEFRTPILLLSIFFIAVLLLILQFQQMGERFSVLTKRQRKVTKEMQYLTERFDLATKVYKLEDKVHVLEMGRKGKFDPIVGLGVLVVVVTIVVVLLVAGIL
ncbi:MAG: hypothetical protein OXR66_07080 [Candidatus Woesearchaeota archaeon]|nr:hypothetical protein [Candidatus Woesearchaeota archaeon]